MITDTSIQLNGSRSWDGDGDPLTYRWYVTRKPRGSNPVLSGSTSITPWFTTNAAGEYQVALSVNDGYVSSLADHLTITVSDHRRGDLNGDGDITWTDVVICAYMSWGLVDPNPASADFTGDGSVTWTDVVKLAYYQWGLITEL
jgi:hypothetical protein